MIKEIAKYQKTIRKDFARKSQTKKSEAIEDARRRLMSAGIIDKNDCLTLPYR